MHVLMVPGIGGSDERHWQTLWQQDLGPAADRIRPSSWDHPDQDDWLDALSRAMRSDTVIVAHSLGCLAVATWLARPRLRTPRGAVLVAPPDREAPSFPDEAASFASSRAALPVPAVVLASSDDPYSSPGAAAASARAWGADLVEVGALGHINSASGLGRWDQGRALLDAFMAGLHTEARGRPGA